MPLNLNYLPGIEKKTGKTTKDFVAAAIEQGMADPELKPGVRIAWLKKEYGLGHGHAMFMAHTIKTGMLKRAKKKKK
jgi:hypothetical protein